MLTTTDAPPASPTFDALGVDADLLAVLTQRGILNSFPIQAATIPPGMAGRDVTGRAPTGSGKTLAFGLPVVARTTKAQPRRPRALILAPTRELAAQITTELAPLGAVRGLRLHAFYGGVGFTPQLQALRRGVDIAVACPGRLADLVSQGACDLGDVSLVVVDEADRMADMGFLPEVRRLLDATSPKRQTLLFSATLDGDVDVLVRRYQNDPVRHAFTPPEVGPVDHEVWLVGDTERTERSAELLAVRSPAIVFTRTRHGADRLAKRLEKAGVPTAALHGGRSQGQRDRALEAFREGAVHALIATDVAARGVHVEGVSCVLHFDLAADAKDYVHRSGRTGRAGATGLVVSFVAPAQRGAARSMLRDASVNALTRESSTVTAHLATLEPTVVVVRPPRATTSAVDRADDGDRRPSGGRPGGRPGGGRSSARSGAQRGDGRNRGGAPGRGPSTDTRRPERRRDTAGAGAGSVTARQGRGRPGGARDRRPRRDAP